MLCTLSLFNVPLPLCVLELSLLVLYKLYLMHVQLPMLLRFQRTFPCVREPWLFAGAIESTACLSGAELPRNRNIAYVGDSTMVLGQNLEVHVSMDESTLKAHFSDHKPADPTEQERIESISGKVVVSAKGKGHVCGKGRGCTAFIRQCSREPW